MFIYILLCAQNIKESVCHYDSLQGQDYICVREFICFLDTVLLTAPKSSANEDIGFILGSIVGLDQELSWLKEASNWEFDFVCFLETILLTAPKGSTSEYISLILGSIVALDQEHSWFKEASNWELTFLIPIHKRQTKTIAGDASLVLIGNTRLFCIHRKHYKQRK